jgi:hypothetical protein
MMVYLLMGCPIWAMADLRWRPAFHLSWTSVNGSLAGIGQ